LDGTQRPLCCHDGRHSSRARPAPNDAARIRAPRHEVNEGTGMRAMIALGITQARAWDRADPVRIIDTSAAA